MNIPGAQKYERFAWMAKYITLIRLADCYMEFVFPERTDIIQEDLQYMLGQSCELDLVFGRPTTLLYHFTDQYLFHYLNMLYKTAAARQYDISKSTHSVKFKFTPDAYQLSPELLESLGPDENELFTECIKAMEIGALQSALILAIDREGYEHAVMIRDEIEWRKKHEA